MRYRYFDYAFDSDIAFPELEPASGCARTLVLRELATPADAKAAAASMRWVPRVCADDGVPWLSIGRAATRFGLEFHGLLFVQYEPARVLWSRRNDRLPDESLRHLLLDQALPAIVAHQGDIVLHAACAIVDARAVLIAGPAGAGKSTATAHLVSNGWHAAADDAAALTVQGAGVLVQPAYGGIRLWPDSRAAVGYGSEPLDPDSSAKRRLRSGPLPAHAVPLTAIYLIHREPSTLEVRDLSRRDAVVALLRNTYVLDTDDRARAQSQLDSLAAVAQRVPVRDLQVPEDFGALRLVATLIERECAGAAR